MFHIKRGSQVHKFVLGLGHGRIGAGGVPSRQSPLERCDTLVTIRPVAFQMKKEKEERREEKKKKRKETENLKILWNPWEYPAFKGSRRIVPRIHYDWFGVCDFASLESKAKFSARHFTSQESGKKDPKVSREFQEWRRNGQRGRSRRIMCMVQFLKINFAFLLQKQFEMLWSRMDHLLLWWTTN